MQIQIPPLAEGEIYLFGLVDANGDIEHTVIVEVVNDRANWQKQMDAAKARDCDLANAIEYAAIRLKHPKLVDENKAYWMNETVNWDSAFARYQGFHYGFQSYVHKSALLGAVVVRRFKN
ncbi:DUF1566 domain-containing protein [Burkholderia sp. IDO3]|uniref:DUF1566 domain-containing protein n=1 Tax=Burkholderia sp. IDO3 TaxID=1705310 RepID=UPI000BBAC9F3|nr:DUF1566 domain-containing protein [Burkholderia sp. IDO3]AXK61504.1 DUF1566 domain-containing protein [Burkholderia sp. IDO3]PCD58198.1 DUF1566 domain-containing protein [Burkholderia sp. IDO3]